MNVTRVEDATGTRIDPPCDDSWDDLTKLQWKAAVVGHDSGLKAEVYISSASPLRYGVLTSRTSGAPYDFQGAWDLLNGIDIGAGEIAARVRQLHRPVDYRGVTICANCSAYADGSCDNGPCRYEDCPTLKAINGEEAP